MDALLFEDLEHISSFAQSFVVRTASTTMSKAEEEPQEQVLLTEDQLVARCVDAFDVIDDDEIVDIQFADSLFLSHQWLSDSLSLITHFVNYYQECRNVEQREAVCRAVSFWIEKFPMHFDAQPQVCAQVVRLKTIAEDVNETVRNGLDVSSLPSFAWLRAVSVRNPLAKQTSVRIGFETLPTPGTPPPFPVAHKLSFVYILDISFHKSNFLSSDCFSFQTAFSLSFVQASASDISTSLSHIDYRVLSRISITELKQYVKDGHLRSCPMLERSISVFNVSKYYEA
uniref:N-terminal Ras-GEF domain-containing protein n=1 Tax=Caenorhabditis tropicalis TaxID=1561998 RepID=A0A1I7SZ84_9PELO